MNIIGERKDKNLYKIYNLFKTIKSKLKNIPVNFQFSDGNFLNSHGLKMFFKNLLYYIFLKTLDSDKKVLSKSIMIKVSSLKIILS